MSNKEFEDEFDQDKEFLTLHEKYKAVSTEEPSEAIDLNVLGAAHSAVNSHHETNNEETPDKIKKINKHAWYVPVSYVAVIVLSLSVFLKLAFDPELMTPEFIESELNGADFVEESFLPEVNRQYADEQDKMPAEQKKIKQNQQRQVVELQKERLEEVARSQRKEKSEPKKRMLLKSQAASKPLVMSPSTRSEVLNNKAGAAAEVTAPMALMSSPVGDQAPVSALAQETTQMPAQESVQDTGGLTQRSTEEADNERQIKHIKELLKLFEAKKLEELKKALAAYRKIYPYNKEIERLPQVIQELEKHWKTEKGVKSLQN